MKIDHVTLSVTDPDRTVAWWRSLLGEADGGEESGPGWRRCWLAWPDGLLLVFVRHDDASDADRFAHARVGLDHLSLSCADEAEVRSWAARLDALGVDHGPVETPEDGWVLTARDPDGIAVEFFAAAPEA